MPYTTDDHRRNHRQIEILCKQRPSRKLFSKSPPQNVTKRHLKRLEWLRYALTASEKEFQIVFLPSFSGAGKKKAKQRHAIQHIRQHRHALNLALSRIHEDINLLNKQIAVAK